MSERNDDRRLSWLEERLRDGKISRREFMGRALALGATFAIATSIASTALQAQTPKKGGRLRLATTGGATSDTLDPALILDTYMTMVSFGQLRNCLTEIAPDGSLIGELAESWEASDDAVTWIFKIRQGVEFHNGKTLDANDVVESINHHRGEDTKSAAKGIISPIQDVKADGKNAVVITLSGGSADFPFLLSDYHLAICPAKSGGGIDWESGVGTGGYVFQSFEPGVRTLTTRSPNYWKTGYGHFDEVESLFISDAGARTNALQSSDIDLMTGVDLKTVHLLKKSPGVVVFQSTGNTHITLPMHTNKPPFDNNDLRLALKYAVDREQWLRVIMKGYGELGNDIPLGPANVYRATTDEIPQRQYDPDKAKFHLKKAGYDSIDLQFHASDTAYGGAVDSGQLYAESARAAGINLEVVREPEDGYWSNVWLKKPFMASYWGGRPTEDWMFSQVYSSGADWNETFWDHERFNELLVAARGELDAAKRREQYVEMQRILHDEGGVIVPIFMSAVSAASDKLYLPEQMASNWALDGNKCAERWWFA